jgi:hypothetical protein
MQFIAAQHVHITDEPQNLSYNSFYYFSIVKMSTYKL